MTSYSGGRIYSVRKSKVLRETPRSKRDEENGGQGYYSVKV
jgi:hypothetical protein